MKERTSEEFNRLKSIVDRCELNTEEDVKNFFIAYTKYIHDYKMLGAIYDCYPEDIVVKTSSGTLKGVDDEVNNTIWCLNTSPDIEMIFLDFMAHKVDDDTFKFIQVTTRNVTATGPSMKGPATNKKLSPANHMNMCECLVKRIDGHWKIVGEWICASDKVQEWLLEPETEEDNH